MKVPLFLAHGQNILAVILIFAASGFAASLGSVLCGLMKKRGQVSKSGVAFAIAAVLYGGGILWVIKDSIHDAEFFWVAALVPLPLGIIGIVLSLRRSLTDEPKV